MGGTQTKEEIINTGPQIASAPVIQHQSDSLTAGALILILVVAILVGLIYLGVQHLKRKITADVLKAIENRKIVI